MLFALGYLAGLVTAVLIVATIALLRKKITSAVEMYATKIESYGPRQRGFLLEPEAEVDEARRERVEANAAEGKDTPISELQ